MNYKPRLRDFGPVDAPLYLLSRALRRLPLARARLFKYRFWVQQLPGARLMPARPGAPTIRILGADDPELAQLPRDPQRVAARIAAGDICLVAIRQERVVASMWLALNGYQEDEIRARFEPLPASRAAWDYDIYIDPGERSGLLFVRLWDAACELLRARGYHSSVSRISSFNLVSSASQARMGARCIGWGVFIILFNWQFMIASLSPFLHVAPPGRQGPTLRLQTTAPARQGSGDHR